MFKITTGRLDCCRTAGEACEVLGERLASYLLRPDLRREAGVCAPPLPDGRCSLVALVVLQRPPNRPDAWPALGRGVGIPLLWRKKEKDSELLPRGFAEIADLARRVTKCYDWGLSFSDLLEGYDLSALSFEVPSIFAPLAAGLILAAQGGTPNRLVFSTGRWQENAGMVEVGCLEEKLEAVRDLAGGERPIFFLPHENLKQVGEKFSADIDIIPYPRGESNCDKVFQKHLAELDVPPPRLADNLEARKAYANRLYIMDNLDKRRNYYIANLLDDLAQEIAAGAQGVLPRGGLSGLVLFLSKNYELCLLLAKALRPRRLLVLYTSDTEKYLEQVAVHAPCAVDRYKYHKENEDHCLEKCRKWLGELDDPRSAAVDVTSGFKTVTLLLAAAAHATGARILYLDHTIKKGRTPEAGSERIRRITWFEL